VEPAQTIGAKFPGIPAPFPEERGIFAQFGQDLRLSGLADDKFTAKFPQAGNLKLQHVSQFLDLPPTAAALPWIVFPQHFSAA
jgi:hypothetical protein